MEEGKSITKSSRNAFTAAIIVLAIDLYFVILSIFEWLYARAGYMSQARFGQYGEKITFTKWLKAVFAFETGWEKFGTICLIAMNLSMFLLLLALFLRNRVLLLFALIFGIGMPVFRLAYGIADPDELELLKENWTAFGFYTEAGIQLLLSLFLILAVIGLMRRGGSARVFAVLSAILAVLSFVADIALYFTVTGNKPLYKMPKTTRTRAFIRKAHGNKFFQWIYYLGAKCRNKLFTRFICV